MRVKYKGETYCLNNIFYTVDELEELKKECPDKVVTILLVKPPHYPKDVKLSELNKRS